MPPMTSLNTFIQALQTGQTKTTKALDHVVAHRRSNAQLLELFRKPRALDAPLQSALRSAVLGAPLGNKYIKHCIDGWPDDQKERMRRAVVTAIRYKHAVRFGWGLTSAAAFTTMIHKTPSGDVEITALTPRAMLSTKGAAINVVSPLKAPAKRRRAARTH